MPTGYDEKVTNVTMTSQVPNPEVSSDLAAITLKSNPVKALTNRPEKTTRPVDRRPKLEDNSV